MTVFPMKERRPSADGRAADQTAQAREPYAGAVEKTSTKPPLWFLRLDIGFWSKATRDLRAAERGVLIDLLAYMIERAEPILEDDARLARRCAVGKALFTRTKLTLLADGRLVRKDGGLWSEVIQAELDNSRKLSETRAKSASQRWGNDEQNQSPRDANAYKTPDSRPEKTGLQPVSAPDSDESSSTSDGNKRSTFASSSDALNASPTSKNDAVKEDLHQRRVFLVDEEIELDGLGKCTVGDVLADILTVAVQGWKFSVRLGDAGEPIFARWVPEHVADHQPPPGFGTDEFRTCILDDDDMPGGILEDSE